MVERTNRPVFVDVVPFIFDGGVFSDDVLYVIRPKLRPRLCRHRNLLTNVVISSVLRAGARLLFKSDLEKRHRLENCVTTANRKWVPRIVSVV